MAEITREEVIKLVNSSGGRVRLAGVDLSGANLSALSLANADLTNANLCEADLSGADLNHANLSACRMSQAVLRGANLQGSTFDGAQLNQADARGANVASASFARADLSGSDFRQARFMGISIVRSLWALLTVPMDSLAGLRGENTSPFVVFARAQAPRADFSETKVFGNFDSAELTAANFTAADLQGSIFTHAILRGANLSRANLQRADLIGSDLTGANVSWARLDFVLRCPTCGVQKTLEEILAHYRKERLSFDPQCPACQKTIMTVEDNERHWDVFVAPPRGEASKNAVRDVLNGLGLTINEEQLAAGMASGSALQIAKAMPSRFANATMIACESAGISATKRAAVVQP